MTATLSFTAPPPGFAPLVDFVLDDIDGAIGLYTLRGLVDGGPRLFVLDASVYLPAYNPEITDEQAAELELTRAEDALLLVVANPGTDGSTTANLMAPIVVNAKTGRSAQLILEGADWPIKAELTRASQAKAS